MKKINLLMDDETLFRDESVFTPSYMPEEFNHRDAQIEDITLAIKPALRGSAPVNALVCGPAGTGKTTAVKYVFEELRSNTNKVIPVYVNCEDYSTPYGIFARIYTTVFGVAPPSTGKPLEEVKEKIFNKLKKDNKALIVALDELDRLFLERNIDRILVDLLKAHSTYGFDRIGVIGITIDDFFVSELEDKTRSVYNPNRIAFERYSPEEIADILSARAKAGFYDGALAEEALERVVELTVEAGDLRTGIDLLRRSALAAEKAAARKVDAAHVEKAYSALPETRKREAEEALSEDDSLLLGLIKGSPGRNSGYFFMKFRDKTGAGVKRYNETVAKLERKGLIKAEYREGVRGRSREIRPA